MQVHFWNNARFASNLVSMFKVSHEWFSTRKLNLQNEFLFRLYQAI
jgi:hypothetical protein